MTHMRTFPCSRSLCGVELQQQASAQLVTAMTFVAVHSRLLPAYTYISPYTPASLAAKLCCAQKAADWRLLKPHITYSNCHRSSSCLPQHYPVCQPQPIHPSSTAAAQVLQPCCGKDSTTQKSLFFLGLLSTHHARNQAEHLLPAKKGAASVKC
jgi:hypothetical protein